MTRWLLISQTYSTKINKWMLATPGSPEGRRIRLLVQIVEGQVDEQAEVDLGLAALHAADADDGPPPEVVLVLLDVQMEEQASAGHPVADHPGQQQLLHWCVRGRKIFSEHRSNQDALSELTVIDDPVDQGDAVDFEGHESVVADVLTGLHAMPRNAQDHIVLGHGVMHQPGVADLQRSGGRVGAGVDPDCVRIVVASDSSLKDLKRLGPTFVPKVMSPDSCYFHGSSQS